MGFSLAAFAKRRHCTQVRARWRLQRRSDATRGRRAAARRALDFLGELGAETAPEVRQRGRLLRAQLREQPIVRCELTLPRIALEAHDLLEAARAEIQSAP